MFCVLALVIGLVIGAMKKSSTGPALGAVIVMAYFAAPYIYAAIPVAAT